MGRVKQESPFCPNIAATPDGKQVWFTLKDIGKTQVFEASPPFRLIKTLETGPITNHVNFAHTATGNVRLYHGRRAPIEVKVFRTDDFSQVATIPVGNLPHGIWPSGDGTRIYVGLENADAAGRHRHRHQPGGRQRAGRAGAAGHRLCAGRRARGRRHAGAPAARRRRADRAARSCMAS